MQNFEINKADPLILIISGLSGAGKDSVIGCLRKMETIDFHFVVTCNTRAPRDGEINGKDYHFITRERFLEMVESGEMVEHSKVYDDYKGVPKFEIDRAFEEGKDLILRLDYQGMQKVKKIYPDAISIFILPPDFETWIGRLRGRGSDTEEALQVRIATAEKELECVPDFDYVVINDELEKAAAEVASIVQAERYRSARRKVMITK